MVETCTYNLAELDSRIDVVASVWPATAQNIQRRNERCRRGHTNRVAASLESYTIDVHSCVDQVEPVMYEQRQTDARCSTPRPIVHRSDDYDQTNGSQVGDRKLEEIRFRDGETYVVMPLL